MLRLITISISHYVEKVKWALELSGIPYKEESHIPGLHATVTLWHTRGRHRSTPVLLDGEQVVPDSTAILQHLAGRYQQHWLYPNRQALELEERFDAAVGPHTRRFIYRQLFDARLSLPQLFSQPVVPAWQAALLPAIAPMLQAAMTRDMQITHSEADRSREIFEAEFDFVAGLLSDGRPFLCGNAISAADITFAALAAPVLLPEEYGAKLPDMRDLPAAQKLHEIVENYRRTPAGKFVLRLYQEHRRTL
ncbi:MAG: glutathione S-transferase family protein [Spirochaetota bacterium]